MAKYSKTKPVELIKLMGSGHSFEGACGEIGIGRNTGYEWAKRYPEWKKAKGLGNDKRLAYLEKLLKSAVYGIIPKEAEKLGGKKLDKILIMFWLKTIHRDLYAERIETDNTHQGDMVFKSRIGPGGEVLQEINSMEDWNKQKTYGVKGILNEENKKNDSKTKKKEKAKG